MTVSCHKNENKTTTYAALHIPPDTLGTAFVVDSFPLAAGHQWYYKLEEQVFYFNFSLGINVPSSSISTSYFTVTSISDTVVNGIRFTKLGIGDTTEAPFLSLHVTKPGEYYFGYLANGLHQFFNVADIDTIHFNDTLVGENVYKMPAVPDPHHWASYDTVSASNLRVWENYAVVTTSTGSFNSLKMKGWFECQTSGFYDEQYFSGKGLVCSVIASQVPNRNTTAGPRTYKIVTLISTNF